MMYDFRFMIYQSINIIFGDLKRQKYSIKNIIVRKTKIFDY